MNWQLVVVGLGTKVEVQLWSAAPPKVAGLAEFGTAAHLTEDAEGGIQKRRAAKPLGLQAMAGVRRYCHARVLHTAGPTVNANANAPCVWLWL